MLRPNPSSGVPIYLQIAEQVREALERGIVRPGEPLPGVSHLSTQLVVSPNVVERAYGVLEHEGVITTDGTGSRVALTHEVAEIVFEESARSRSAGELVRENRLLNRRIATETADRLERRRELARAEEVQQQLFPQVCPPILGLEYSGMCRPALGVGGDYYDFFPMSETSLGIAVGDVSGKGIAAALLMATLRAYVHTQTDGRVADLSEFVERLNRLLYESSTPNRYATFFYGQYDAASRVLRYVNAGHNAPMLFRGCHHERGVLRLEPGGPVIGLFPTCLFSERRITLEPGDVLLLFTDGITEALNPDGDEWGEERLADALARNHDRSARALAERVLRAADAFAGGAPQYDDMTAVVVRAIQVN